MNKLLIALSVIISGGLVIVPLSVFYIPQMTVFSIAAAIVAGVAAFLFLRNEECERDRVNKSLEETKDSIKGSMDALIAKMCEFQETVNNHNKELSKYIESSNDKLKDLGSSLVQTQISALEKLESNIQIGLKDNLNNISTLIQKQTTAIEKLDSNVQYGSENVNKNKETILNLQSELFPLIKDISNNKQLINDANETLANINEYNKSSHEHLKRILQIIESVSGITISLDKLEESIESIKNLQEDLERQVEKQVNISNLTIQETSKNMKHIVSEMKENISDNNKNFQRGLQESLNDVVEKLDFLSEYLKETIDDGVASIEEVMNDCIKYPVESLCDYGEQLKGLYHSEESLLKEFSNICRNRKN